MAFRRKFSDQLTRRGLQPELPAVVAGTLEERILIASKDALQKRECFVVLMIDQSLASSAHRSRQRAICREINPRDGVLIIASRVVALIKLRRLNKLPDGDARGNRDRHCQHRKGEPRNGRVAWHRAPRRSGN